MDLSHTRTVSTHPGDGGVYQASNVTILTYGGGMQFSGEEDVYNPASFAPVVTSWMAAWKDHHPS